MRHDFLDRYSRLDSPIHRLRASFKLIAALSLMVAVLLMPISHAAFLGVEGAILVVVAAISRIPWRFLAKRLVMLEPFVIGVAVLALFGPGGWRLFAFIVAKCTLCLLVMLLLSNTTPFSRLLEVLKAAHVPSLMVTTLALMYRYLFVLIDEAGRMKRARASRTFVATRGRQWRTLASVAGQLFIRTSERAERIYGAMCARGWR